MPCRSAPPGKPLPSGGAVRQAGRRCPDPDEFRRSRLSLFRGGRKSQRHFNQRVSPTIEGRPEKHHGRVYGMIAQTRVSLPLAATVPGRLKPWFPPTIVKEKGLSAEPGREYYLTRSISKLRS